jgi:flagellar biosynthetic protein FliQ
MAGRLSSACFSKVSADSPNRPPAYLPNKCSPHYSSPALPITAANVGKVADMDAQDAINLTQQAMFTALLLGAPILLAGVLVGLLIGLAQALTQIQDQTVAFVPKIVAMVGILIVCLPWLVQKMVEYSEALITNIPKTILGG